MKKKFLLLRFILLFIPLSVLSLDASHLSKEVSSTLKRAKRSRIEMSRTSSSPRTRSSFEHLLVFQFEDKLEIVAFYPLSARIDIMDNEGNVVYKGRLNLKQSERTTMSINHYESGQYSIIVSLADDDFYSGYFIIE